MGRKSREKRERREAEKQARRRRQPTAAAVSPAPEVTPQPAASVGGVTQSERHLARLCAHTFLSLWSYPNVHRDQGKGQTGQGKELCDLLVVFENDVLVFSDKECEFPDSGNLDLDWSRWYRRAIKKSADQLWGAERWIKEHPDRIFIDAACSTALPVSLPSAERIRFHLIVVAHGAARRCRPELGGSGSLMVMTGIVGDQHARPRKDAGVPFAVGRVDPARSYVHVLDDTTLDVLLTTLDTVSDFVAYLRKKEAFIESGRILTGAGEEELLAFYLTKVNEHGEHDFVVPADINGLALDEGFWDDFLKSDERRRQREANEVSYAWDHLIEHFNAHFRSGSLELVTDSSAAAHEKIMRFFARESRTRRRMLARTIFELISTTPAHLRRTHVVAPSHPGDPHYVFLLLPWSPARSYEENRKMRRDVLDACCMVAKLVYNDALDIVGFATETARREEGSEDAAYFDARGWTPDMEAQAKELQRVSRILTNAVERRGTEFEYPD